MRGSTDGLWDWDVKSGTVYYSPRWLALMGAVPGLRCSIQLLPVNMEAHNLDEEDLV